MNDDATTRWALPWLHAGQAQKEITHNEALLAIDALLHPCARMGGTNTPPPAPTPGDCHLVGTAPAGEWAEQANAVACRTAGGWRFFAPAEGMAVWIESENRLARFREGGWHRAAGPVALPEGGSTIDSEARSAIASLAAALRLHGLVETR